MNQTQPLQIRIVVSEPFSQNSYVIWRDGRSDGLVIDPGFDPGSILAELQRAGVTPTAVLNTHGHADHIAGNEAMKMTFPAAPLLIGVNEAYLLGDADANLSRPYGMPVLSPPADRLLTEGEVLDMAGIRLEVIEVPGHSPGHVVFLCRDEAPIVVFGGDVLFQGSIGRTDFPGSNNDLLLNGIRAKLYCLPFDTVVYPGHGPATTIGQEREFNPFVRA